MQAAGKVGRAGTVCLQFWGQREETEWGLGGEGRVFMGTEFQLGKREKFWRWRVGVAAQHSESTYCHPTQHLTVVKII